MAQTAAALAYFTVMSGFWLHHRKRYIAKFTRCVETEPTTVNYEEGSRLTLRIIPATDSNRNMYVNEQGWAVDEGVILRLVKEIKLSQT